jgi:uncharacterized protein YbjT (DUF2867 family)
MIPESGSSRRPRILIVGGTGGLVGRALREEFRSDHDIRSLHRHRVPAEDQPGIEWVPQSVETVRDWRPILKDVDEVVNVTWYRFGSDRRFQPLAEGLLRLIRACEDVRGVRFVQLSVPPAPPEIETGLPYLVRKREVDAALARSGLAYSIVRPTMLFGPRDKLLTVLLRTANRWHRLPMFGEGRYHISPISVGDLARIVRREAATPHGTTVDAGGPRRWEYRELTGRLFHELGVGPRYLRLSAAGGRRLARLLETFGSSLLYAYEVDWLVSDMLGLPPYVGLSTPLEPVEGFVRAQVETLHAGRGAASTR